MPAAPSETSTEDRNEPTDEGGKPEQIHIHAPEVDALAAQAELLHLPHDEPMATQTQTQVRKEPPYISINPVMGHAMNVDEDTAENSSKSIRLGQHRPPGRTAKHIHPTLAISRPWKHQLTTIPSATATTT
jgi:hypothetical protein